MSCLLAKNNIATIKLRSRWFHLIWRTMNIAIFVAYEDTAIGKAIDKLLKPSVCPRLSKSALLQFKISSMPEKNFHIGSIRQWVQVQSEHRRVLFHIRCLPETLNTRLASVIDDWKITHTIHSAQGKWRNQLHIQLKRTCADNITFQWIQTPLLRFLVNGCPILRSWWHCK